MKKMTTFAMCVMVAVLAQRVHADLIARYEFAGASPSATTSDANVTAGDFTVGTGLSGFGGFSGSGNAFARTTGTFGTTLSFANASANDDFLSVIIGPNSGHEMDLASLTFDFGYSSTASGDGDLRAYLTTSIDNHAAFLGFDTVTSVSVSGPTYPVSASIDLSTAAFQDLGSDTEFRIYLSDQYNLNDTIHRVDNVVLNGTVTAIPEPGTTELLGLGLLMIARLCRGKRV